MALQKKAEFILFAKAFLNSLVFFAPVALLVRTRCGIDSHQIFILQAILSLAIFCFEIPCGFLTDKIGYKKTIVLSQFFLCAVRLIFLLGGNFFMFAFAAILESFSYCFESGTMDSYMYKIYNEENFMVKSAVMGNWATAGFIVSTILFIPMNKFLGLEALILWTLVGHTLALVASFFLPDEKRFSALPKEKQESSKQVLRSMGVFIKKILTKQMILVFFFTSFLSLGVFIINFFYIVKLEEIGISDEWMSGIILAYSSIELLSPFILKRIAKFNSAKVLSIEIFDYCIFLGTARVFYKLRSFYSDASSSAFDVASWHIAFRS